MIWTIRGFMDEAALTKTEGSEEDDRAVTTWQEWRAADGEIVKRDVQIVIKQGHEFALDQGVFA